MLTLVACAALCAGAAFAKASHRSPYTYQQTFGSALRLLKVDLGHEVTEVNAEWGYILFVYIDSESGKRKNRGAITLVKDDEDKSVTVSVEIPEMPSYHEELVLQKLKRKLVTEHGEPPKPAKKKKRKKKKKKKKKDKDGDKPDDDKKKPDEDEDDDD